jgi:aminoglycoside 2''-phosphotransferase
VREQFPQLAVQSVEFLESGWSYDAYLVDQSLVFRFPRHAGVALKLDRQERILDFVGSAVGAYVGIPRAVLRGAPSARFPYSFTAHEFIPGAQAWSVAVTPELADDVGRALARIHSIDVSAAAAIDVPEASENCRAVFEELKRELNAVPATEAVAPGPYQWFAADPVVPNEGADARRFIHGDLLPRHIIVSRDSGRLAGILDWEPQLGDPALDFSYLLFCGSLSFLRRALDAYDLPGDPGLLERAVFLGRMRSLAWLAGAIRGGWGPLYLDFVRNAFGEDQ